MEKALKELQDSDLNGRTIHLDYVGAKSSFGGKDSARKSFGDRGGNRRKLFLQCIFVENILYTASPL